CGDPKRTRQHREALSRGDKQGRVLALARRNRKPPLALFLPLDKPPSRAYSVGARCASAGGQLRERRHAEARQRGEEMGFLDRLLGRKGNKAAPAEEPAAEVECPHTAVTARWD